jgi:glutamate-1-semialdehyde aminotransferase
MNSKIKINTRKGAALWEKAKKIIPGGGQLLSKRGEMFLPGLWPSYYKKAKGVIVEDLDGNKFLDMALMGVGSCILGYADPDVNRAVKKVIDNGSMSTLNAPEEVELAELLCKIHPWADMARFARTGGEAAAIAVRIARAHSKKDKVAFCGYHGWLDWYLSSNLADNKNLDGHLLAGLKPAGVPRGLKGTALPFHYNKIKELENIVSNNKGEIGTIVMEPYKYKEPENGFLLKVRKIADEIGAVLVFDEISIGWRVHPGGIHMLYGVKPDIAVFSKAIGNGYPMAAVIGTKKVMEAAQETFISSTNWTEKIGPAAALATIKKIRKNKVPAHLKKIGGYIRSEARRLIKKYDLAIKIVGPEALVIYQLNFGKENQAIKTLFIQEMLRRGILASMIIYISYAHQKSHADQYLKALDEVLAVISRAVKEKSIDKFLEGKISHEGFQRLN